MNLKKFYVIIIIFILGLSIVSVSNAYSGTGFSHNIPFSKYSNKNNYDILNQYNDTDCNEEVKGTCTYVVDGDTIDVEGVGRIRFVGVNTPERGDEGYITSKRFVQKLCLNKEISLDIDDSRGTDKYGRHLAVVIVDKKNLNEMLLKENLAEVMYIPPSEFYPYDWDDSNNTSSYSSSKNVSSSSSVSSNSGGLFIANSGSNKFHKSSCIWGKKISDTHKVSFSSRFDAISQGYEPCKICQP